jgi:hypothetical protein
METQAQTMFSTPRREPMNKGKLIGQKRRCGRNMFGRSVLVRQLISDAGVDVSPPASVAPALVATQNGGGKGGFAGV